MAKSKKALKPTKTSKAKPKVKSRTHKNIREVEDNTTDNPSVFTRVKRLTKKELLKRKFGIFEQVKKANEAFESEKEQFMPYILKGLNIPSKIKFNPQIHFSTGELMLDEDSNPNIFAEQGTNPSTQSQKYIHMGSVQYPKPILKNSPSGGMMIIQ